MSTLTLNRFALGVSVAVLLAGCGGRDMSPPSTVGPGNGLVVFHWQ